MSSHIVAQLGGAIVAHLKGLTALNYYELATHIFI